MLNRTISYILLLAIVLCIGCNNSKSSSSQREKIGNWALKKAGTLLLPVDSITPNATYVINDYFASGDREYLSLVDQNNNNINIYDLKNKTLYKRIHLSKDGPNGIGDLYTADFINFDSILVRGSSSSKLYLIDSSAVVRKTFYIKLVGKDLGRELYIAPNGKQLLLGKSLFGFLNPTVNNRESRHNLTDLPFYTYSIADSSTRTIKAIRFPNVIAEEKRTWAHYNFEPSFCRFGEKIAFSFPVSDSISIYDPVSEATISHFVPSVEGYQRPDPLKSVSIEKLLQGGKDSYLNYIVRYDPYNDVFYRFVFHPLEQEANYTDIYFLFADKPITIQIIDAKDFTIKGETKLPSKKFYFRDFFITPEGLYLSNNNPSNLENKEDLISYTQLKISKNDNQLTAK